MKIKNWKEFKALCEQYRSLTLEDLQKAGKERESELGRLIMFELTGFGSLYKCVLCRAVGIDKFDDPECGECVWSLSDSNTNSNLNTNLSQCIETKGYLEIENAQSVLELYDAIQIRIETMDEMITRFGE